MTDNRNGPTTAEHDMALGLGKHREVAGAQQEGSAYVQSGNTEQPIHGQSNLGLDVIAIPLVWFVFEVFGIKLSWLGPFLRAMLIIAIGGAVGEGIARLFSKKACRDPSKPNLRKDPSQTEPGKALDFPERNGLASADNPEEPCILQRNPVSATVDEAESQGRVQDGPKGVGGWLSLFCVGLILLSPLLSLARMIVDWRAAKPAFDQFPTLKAAVMFENMGIVALLIYGFVVGCIVRSGSPYGRKVAKQYLLVRLFGFMGIELITFLIVAGLRSDIFKSVFNLVIGSVISGLFYEGGYFVIWWFYFKKSKRVRNTYGNEDPLFFGMAVASQNTSKLEKESGSFALHVPRPSETASGSIGLDLHGRQTLAVHQGRIARSRGSIGLDLHGHQSIDEQEACLVADEPVMSPPPAASPTMSANWAATVEPVDKPVVGEVETGDDAAWFPFDGDEKAAFGEITADAASAAEWHVIHDGNEYGPFSLAALVGKAKAVGGEIEADDLVKQTGGLWAKARDFGFLQKHFLEKLSREKAKPNAVGTAELAEYPLISKKALVIGGCFLSALVGIAAALAISKPENPPTLAGLEAAPQIHSKDARFYFNGGKGWADNKEYDKAIIDFDEAIRLDPEFAGAFNKRGIAWRNKKEYDKAIADFGEAIRLNPNRAVFFNNRGNAWRNKKDFDKAIADFGEAIRLDPNFALAFTNRGLVWFDKKDFDIAMWDFDEAIRLDPHNAFYFFNRGRGWHNKKEYDKAIKDLDEAIRLDPKHAMAFNNRGVAWRNKKQYDKAIADFDEAIRLKPNFALAFKNRGNSWKDKREYGKATRDWNEAHRLDPIRFPR